MDDGPRWRPDPAHGGQERYWSGSDWTDRVRPAGRVGSLHLPDHVPALQRALAAATADIDAVEDRLSVLFERADKTPGPGSAPGRPRSEAPNMGGDEPADQSDEDADMFAELNAALAAEEADQSDRPDGPDGPVTARRTLFRRRS